MFVSQHIFKIKIHTWKLWHGIILLGLQSTSKKKKQLKKPKVLGLGEGYTGGAMRLLGPGAECYGLNMKWPPRKRVLLPAFIFTPPANSQGPL
jgi:hypothetical protein